MLIITIDIGTNTLLLNISKIIDEQIVVLEDIQRIARLGFDVDKSKNINDDAIKRAEIILLEYRNIINKYITEQTKDNDNKFQINVIGTSALRDAENKKYVLEKLEKVIENKINIISGEEEARLSFIGTLENNLPSFVFDIGGGSTELIYGTDNKILFRESINIGAVRITERFLKNSPPDDLNLNNAKKFVQTELINLKSNLYKYLQSIEDNVNEDILEEDIVNEDIVIKVINPIVVAGTATSMASIIKNMKVFDYNILHNSRYSIDEVEEKLNLISKLNKQQIVNDLYVPEQRADILLGGAVILYEFLNVFNLNHYICSCKGLRYGPLIDKYNKMLDKV